MINTIMSRRKVILGLGTTDIKDGKADMLTYWVTLMDVE